ncbi:class I SAM-dependent methyltransferase [Actinorugispora endophytica]|uniref:class I SAM-dependent methyltransferase n=1 Tax=Actinorugispora endophytica TaxID=1605990 RepID=UPI001AAD6A5C|nr:class I SAM-dependent methyltransferase [Actinorugispora endophytica]
MDEHTERTREQWDRMSAGYDRGAGAERWIIGDTRARLCGQARGRTLEVAVGTGRNLAFYPDDVELTAVDLSPGMLSKARAEAARLGRRVGLGEGDAQNLPFPDGSFDTVVCTLALCSIPDQAAGLAEMYRVLRPGGGLLIVDHIEYTRAPVRWIERRRGRRRAAGPRRRPMDVAVEQGFVVDRHDRLALGFFDRVAAHRPE